MVGEGTQQWWNLVVTLDGLNTFLNIAASIISAIAASLVGMVVCRSAAFADRRYSFAAASSVAMSNSTMFIIAAIALGCFRMSPILSCTICQHRPNLSVSQPQGRVARFGSNADFGRRLALISTWRPRDVAVGLPAS